MSDKKSIRELMKLSRPVSNVQINDKFAKYNSIGQLMCVLCNENVDSKLWQIHKMKKGHKQKLEAQLRGDSKSQSKRSIRSDGQSNAVPPPLKKRFEEEKTAFDAPPTKIVFSENSAQIRQNDPNDNVQVARDDDNKNNLFKMPQSTVAQSKRVTLKREQTGDINKVEGVEQPIMTQSEANSAATAESKSSLPEGFFDDPARDAREHGHQLRDIETEEFEAFKRDIGQIIKNNEEQTEMDDETRIIERNVSEFEEKMSVWRRINQLEKKSEERKQSKTHTQTGQSDSGNKEEEEESSSSSNSEDGEDDEEEESDEELGSDKYSKLAVWRRKQRS